MSWVTIHPRFQQYFRHCGLRSAGDFLRLPGVILCGHPDRHVMHVHVEPDDSSFGMFLKKEHCIPWRERLASYRYGFGFVSRSAREARQLELLRQAGIGCPEPLAVGEEGGQAFLLLREQKGDVDLRAYLAAHPERTCRGGVARSLGDQLARMHGAGFCHAELFAKHILVSPAGEFCILDWQRARAPHVLTQNERLADLAALDASLADALASRTDRLVCLQAYLEATLSATLSVPGSAWDRTAARLCRAFCPVGRQSLPAVRSQAEPGTERMREAALRIREQSRRLSKRARIREQREPCLPRGQQHLIWLAGESLCVTRQLQQRPGQLAELMRRIGEPLRVSMDVEHSQLVSTSEKNLNLVRRRASRFGSWLRSLCRRRVFVSPEFEQAATIFRLERHGITPPKLLAVGQDFERPWRTASFLLTEAPDADLSLMRFLEWADRRERWQLLEQAGRLLRRLHEAGYRASSVADWAVQGRNREAFTLVLTSVAGLVRARGGYHQDLAVVCRELESCCSRADVLRFRRAYEAAASIEPRIRVRAGRRLSA